MSRIDFNHIEQLWDNQKIDDVFNILIKRADELSKYHQSDDNALFLSDAFALCARDINTHREKLLLRLAKKEQAKKQQQDYEQNIRHLKIIWQCFNQYTKIAEEKQQASQLPWKYNPTFPNNDEKGKSIPLNPNDSMNLFNLSEQEFLDLMTFEYKDYLNKIIEDICWCICEIYRHTDWLSDKKTGYSDINNNDYCKKNTFGNKYTNIKKGNYFKYIEIIYELNKYQPFNEKISKIISDVVSYRKITYYNDSILNKIGELIKKDNFD